MNTLEENYYQFADANERREIIRWTQEHPYAIEGVIQMALLVGSQGINLRQENKVLHSRPVMALVERYPFTDLHTLAPLGNAILQLVSEGEVPVPGEWLRLIN